ncbi:MAG: hypothetical protein B7Y39_07970 [Bdellovibrio sp. 28-41-41]|nr:MAG: hypothetical protein B7Y39_07970 [Bdellovibrio sp. 28-41-41]
MHNTRLTTTVLVFFALASSLLGLNHIQAQESAKDPLSIQVAASPSEIKPKNEYSVQLNLQLPKGFHAYEDQFKVTVLEPSGIISKTITLNPLKKWFDKFSKKDRTGIEGNSSMTILLETPDRFVDDNGKLVFELTYQACSDAFCLFPKSKDVSIPVTFTGKEKATPANMPKDMSLFSTEGFSYFLGQSLWLALILAFLAGIVTSFTPCIFPMIPITLAILNNHSERRTRLTNFLISIIYVLGIATTYSILGLLAAKSGMLFGSILSNPYVLSFICGLFFLMALSMYGAFELQMPSFITQRFGQGPKQKGYLGAYLSGLFAGIVASPCVGPVLVSILTYVSTQQSSVFGFFLLFTYAMGMGLIFIVLGSSTELLRKLPRSGPWMETTKVILGTLMLVGFFYYFELLVPMRVFQSVLGVALVTLASLYGAFLKPGNKKRDLIRKGFMQAALILGFAFFVMGVTGLDGKSGPNIEFQDVKFNKDNLWKPFSESALEQAKLDKKTVIVDFFADWCAACWELEEKVFTTAEFRERAKNIVLLKMDATKDSTSLNELKKKYGIVGLPTILFFDSTGTWIKAKTLTEFENKDKFFKRIEDVK